MNDIKKRFYVWPIIFSVIFGLSSCASLAYDEIHAIDDDCRIYLYGERHGQQLILDKEVELWEEYYIQQGFRHLFIEIGYCDAQLLNQWMKAEDNEILDVYYKNLEGTLSHTQANYDLFVEIKKRCPETVFHGTDVEHQFYSTGRYYVSWLTDQDLTETVDYLLAEESCTQGYEYNNGSGDTEAYRENKLVNNFIREFDALESDEKIMGIYGAQHTVLNKKNYTKSVKNMITQLNEYYEPREGKIIHSTDISRLK